MGQLRDDLRADYKVNTRLLDRMTVTAFRFNQAAQRGRLRAMKRVLAKIVDALWLQLVVGADLPGRAKIGPGLRMPHGGRGVTLHPNVAIGSNAVIYHRCTVGGFTSDKTNVPTIGNDFYLGAAAQVMGRVTIGNGVRVGAGAQIASTALTIGDNARVSAGAVPFEDVPDGQTVYGNPAVVRVKP
jgi:serine O-acetyltransferase